MSEKDPYTSQRVGFFTKELDAMHACMSIIEDACGYNESAKRRIARWIGELYDYDPYRPRIRSPARCVGGDS